MKFQYYKKQLFFSSPILSPHSSLFSTWFLILQRCLVVSHCRKQPSEFYSEEFSSMKRLTCGERVKLKIQRPTWRLWMIMYSLAQETQRKKRENVEKSFSTGAVKLHFEHVFLWYFAGFPLCFILMYCIQMAQVLVEYFKRSLFKLKKLAWHWLNAFLSS